MGRSVLFCQSDVIGHLNGLTILFFPVPSTRREVRVGRTSKTNIVISVQSLFTSFPLVTITTQSLP